MLKIITLLFASYQRALNSGLRFLRYYRIALIRSFFLKIFFTSCIFLVIGLGYLTIDTLKSILLELEPNLGEEQLMEIVEEVDEDGSGTIDFDGEF